MLIVIRANYIFNLNKARKMPEKTPYEYKPYYRDVNYRHENVYRARLEEFPEVAIYPKEAEELKGEWARGGSKLCVDVGCAEGDLIIALAKSAPDNEFVGLDVRFKRVAKAAERTTKEGIANARFIRYDGAYLNRLFAPGEIDELYFLFPDPWPKLKQKKHRLFSVEKLKEWLELLKPGGAVELKTDHADYFEQIKEVLAASRDVAKVALLSENLYADETLSGRLPKTRFERLFTGMSKPIKYVRIEKI